MLHAQLAEGASKSLGTAVANLIVWWKVNISFEACTKRDYDAT